MANEHSHCSANSQIVNRARPRPLGQYLKLVVWSQCTGRWKIGDADGSARRPKWYVVWIRPRNQKTPRARTNLFERWRTYFPPIPNWEREDSCTRGRESFARAPTARPSLWRVKSQIRLAAEASGDSASGTLRCSRNFRSADWRKYDCAAWSSQI